MDNKLLILRLVLDEIAKKGVNVSSEEFAGRKNAQKLIYILQAKGYPLDYSYNWYLRGPYSPALAHDFFLVDATLRDHYQEQARNYTLNENVQKEISELLTLLGMSDENFEAAASALFLRSEKQMNDDAAVSEMRKRKPELTSVDEPKVRGLLKLIPKE